MSHIFFKPKIMIEEVFFYNNNTSLFSTFRAHFKTTDSCSMFFCSNNSLSLICIVIVRKKSMIAKLISTCDIAQCKSYSQYKQ